MTEPQKNTEPVVPARKKIKMGKMMSMEESMACAQATIESTEFGREWLAQEEARRANPSVGVQQSPQ